MIFFLLVSWFPKAQVLHRETQIYEPSGGVSHREIGLSRCNAHCSPFSNVTFELYTLLSLSIPSFIASCKAVTRCSGSAQSAFAIFSLTSFLSFYLGRHLCFGVPDTLWLTLCGLAVCISCTLTSAFTFHPSLACSFSAFHSSRSTAFAHTVSSHILEENASIPVFKMG